MPLSYELLRLFSLVNMSFTPAVLGWLTWVVLNRTDWVQEDLRVLVALFVFLFINIFCVIGGLLSYQLHMILKALKK